MTQEEKYLVLRDLFPRVPYAVKCQFDLSVSGNKVYKTIVFDNELDDLHVYWIKEGLIKPYLRPMSSMTEEEEARYNLIQGMGHWTIDDGKLSDYADAIDWLNEHHFDYRRLIEKGLALEAPKDMY